MFNKLYLLFIPVMLVVLTGCGMKKEVKDSLTRMEARVNTSVKTVANNKIEFTKSKDAKELAFYIKKENLNDYFTKADKQISEALKYLKTSKALVAADDSKDERTVTKNLLFIRSLMDKAHTLSTFPKNRLSALIKTKKEAPSLMKKANKTAQSLDKLVTFKITELDKAIKDFPLKKKDLTVKKEDLIKLNDSVKTNVTIATNEIAKNSKMDVSNFLNATEAVNKLDKKTKQVVYDYASKIKQLNTSYTKILSDMKARHFVLVGRVSWDNYYDYPTENKYVYSPREVPTSTIEKFYAVNGTIATYSSGFLGGFKVKMPANLWAYLKINPTQSLPSGDDEGEYWIENIKSKYYQKYIIVENGIKKEGDFVEVSEKVFYSQQENLGMSIVTKPYGFYESEADTKATPPGLGFVGNPKYGQWKQDSSGNSFFHYYGMYSMFSDLTGSRYSRSYYDDYNTNYRGRNNYYSGGYGTYGSRTYSSGSRFASSRYARTNKGLASKAKSGGFKGRTASTGRSSTSTGRSSSSVRSAGSSSRGRGPGGGGK